MQPSRLVRAAVAAFLALGLALSSRPAHAGKEYPLDADEFRQEIDRRIARVRSAIEKKLDHHGVSAARKLEVKRVVELAAKDIHEAVDRVTADGSVSRDEAKEVRALTKSLRGKVKARLRAEKDKSHHGKKDPKDAPPKDGNKKDKDPEKKKADDPYA